MSKHSRTERAALIVRLSVALSAVACSGPDARPTRSAAAPRLEGTWRALEYVRRSPRDTVRSYPFGQPPRAYLVYDATGHVFFQAVRGIAAASDARGRWSRADSATLHDFLSDAAAYFGVHQVNYGSRTVVHRIEAEIPPNAGATEIATPFRLQGDSLILGPDSATHWTFIRVR